MCRMVMYHSGSTFWLSSQRNFSRLASTEGNSSFARGLQERAETCECVCVCVCVCVRKRVVEFIAPCRFTLAFPAIHPILVQGVEQALWTVTVFVCLCVCVCVCLCLYLCL